MSGPMFGVGASGKLRAEYRENMEALSNADWLQLQVPHGGVGEPGGGADYYPQEYIPQDPVAWEGDPGIWVEPAPEWGGDPGIYVHPETGFDGDPGIYAEPPYVSEVPVNMDHPGPVDVGRPPYVEEPRPSGRVLAPSIVPGLDWMTGGPYHELGPAGEAPPATEPSADPTAQGGREPLGVGDYIGEGAKGFLLPSLIGGVVSGALAAAAARGTGLGGLAFGSRVIGNVALGVATGAGAGLLVAATSPKPGDSLTARYAVAGGLLGAAGGAAFPGGTSRAFSAVLGAVTGAVVAGFTGSRIENPA